MHRLRPYAFAASFYTTTALFLILGSPLLLLPRAWAMAGLRAHARTCLWLLRHVAGTTYEVRGLEHLVHGPCIVVSKHQSAWETFALIPLFRDPAIVLKEELTRIPVYGWFCRKFEHILVARDRRAAALKAMIETARTRADAGREILLFAEGTRTEPGAAPSYKPGYVALYQALELPIVPIALNSGLYWPRRSGLCYPGHIIAEIAPAIPAGLERGEVQSRLVGAIETRSNALILEAANSQPEARLIQDAVARLQDQK